MSSRVKPVRKLAVKAWFPWIAQTETPPMYRNESLETCISVFFLFLFLFVCFVWLLLSCLSCHVDIDWTVCSYTTALSAVIMQTKAPAFLPSVISISLWSIATVFRARGPRGRRVWGVSVCVLVSSWILTSGQLHRSPQCDFFSLFFLFFFSF